jgi:hypothetical protein
VKAIQYFFANDDFNNTDLLIMFILSKKLRKFINQFGLLRQLQMDKVYLE